VGDYLLVNRLSYVMKVPFTDIVLLNIGQPKRGDTIVFRYPEDHSKDFIKRVIAKEGDTVEIRDKVVYVNGSKVEDGNARFADHSIIPGNLSERDNFGPVIVPKDSYFAMGDNRDNSLDSRFWGFVKKDELVGKAVILYFSWNGRGSYSPHTVGEDRPHNTVTSGLTWDLTCTVKLKAHKILEAPPKGSLQ
jgi:signal peptidase I